MVLSGLKSAVIGFLTVGLCVSCSSRNVTVVPDSSWPCGMPEGIPCPEAGRLIFVATLALDKVYPMGQTPYGDRTVSVVKGGAVSGAWINASVMSGGLDFELKLSNGVVEVEQVLLLRTDDGQIIYLHNLGIGLDSEDVRVVMDFEAANDHSYAKLHSGRFVARRRLDPSSMTMMLTVYDVSEVAEASCVPVVKPHDRSSQPETPPRTVLGESKDLPVFGEKVTLGAWCTTGAGKRGVRNVIPITGGTFWGNVEGVVLSAGADYQLKTENSFTLDARYLWQTKDGEIIIVRNTGSFGALVPTFETRVDGPYAWLNSGHYLSHDPEVGDGFVCLDIYEVQP